MIQLYENLGSLINYCTELFANYMGSTSIFVIIPGNGPAADKFHALDIELMLGSMVRSERDPIVENLEDEYPWSRID
jgi:hypothetical protein